MVISQHESCIGFGTYYISLPQNSVNVKKIIFGLSIGLSQIAVH